MPKYRFTGSRVGHDGIAYTRGDIVEMPETSAAPLSDLLVRVGDAERQSEGERVAPPTVAQVPKPSGRTPKPKPKAQPPQQRAAKNQRRASAK